jgi:DNA primase
MHVNPSSYKYLDKAPTSLIIEVVCSSLKPEINDVLGSIMSVPSTHPSCSISTLLNQKSIGRIKILEKSKDSVNTIKKFEVDIPIKTQPVIWALLVADIEQLSFVGSTKSSFKFLRVKYEASQREVKVIERAREILAIGKPKEESELNQYFSEFGYNPIEEKEVKVIQIDKEKGIYGSPNYKTSDRIILVEGVSDIRTIVRSGYEGVISINGYTIKDSLGLLNELIAGKKIIIFMDGDRGGLSLKEDLKKGVSATEIRVVEEEGYGEVQLLTKLQIDSILSRAVVLKK